jgi:hypothetical protein
MKLIFLFLLLYLFQLSYEQNPLITIQGKIVDSTTSEGISLVKIDENHDNNKTEIGTSCIDGSFTIKLSAGLHKIEFSHIAYSSKVALVKIKPRNNKILSIVLEPKIVLLDEVIIEGSYKKNAHKIVEAVKKKFPTTLRVGPFQCDGHLTSTRMKDGKYVFFGEAFFDFHNSGYAPVGHAYPVLRATNYRISNQDYSYTSCQRAFFPEPVYHLHCYDNYLLPILLNEYFNFEYSDTIFQGTTKLVVINYELNKEKFNALNIEKSKYSIQAGHLQYGQIIIDPENYSIVRIVSKGYNTEEKGEFISTTNFSNFNQARFISNITLKEAYSESGIGDGKAHQILKKTKISYFNFTTDSLSDEDLAGRYHCKVFIDNRFQTNSRYFSYIPNSEDKVCTYNPEFWRKQQKPGYWQQMKTDIEAMAGKPLKEQFSANSFFLISEEKFKSIMQTTNRLKRKELMNMYKELRKIIGFK